MAKVALKYDWQLFRALYIGGMKINDILRTNAFKGLARPSVEERRKRENWDATRDRALEESAGQIGKDLALVRQSATVIHQEFMIDRLAHERRVINLTSTSRGGKDQRERLENLRLVDELSRKALDMDKQPIQSPKQKNLSILLQMKRGGGIEKVLVNETESSEGQNGATTIGVMPYDDSTRDIMKEVREIMEAGGDTTTPIDPSIPIPSRFKIKEDSPSIVKETPPEPTPEPLVNENPSVEEICREAFPTARVEAISEGIEGDQQDTEGA